MGKSSLANGHAKANGHANGHIRANGSPRANAHVQANGNLKNKIGLETHQGAKTLPAWQRAIPSSVLPYVLLLRIQLGPVLLFWHGIWGALLGIAVQRTPLGDIWRPLLTTFLWTLSYSNALHIWNDLIDAPLDALLERTKNRPIPSGVISEPKAFAYFLSQCVATGAVVWNLNENLSPIQASIYAMPACILAVYYPYAKRMDPIPQLSLGVFCGWCSVVGFVTTGMQPFASLIASLGAIVVDRPGTTGASVDLMVIYLVAAGCLFVMANDTIYAYQDIQDDEKNGVGNMAVLIQGFAKAVLFTLAVGATWSLFLTGHYAGFGMPFNIISVGGLATITAVTLASVRLEDAEHCWWWFTHTHYAVGISIASGIIAEYVVAII